MRANTAEHILEGIILLENGCWGHVTRPNDRKGYRRVKAPSGVKVLLHIWVHEHLRGARPDGLEAHHDCLNKGCCNPDHLRWLTRLEHRRLHTALVTHCPQGHEYTPENSLISTSGRRCRECQRRRHYLDRERLRAEGKLPSEPRGFMQTPEYKQKQREKSLGRQHSAEAKERMAESARRDRRCFKAAARYAELHSGSYEVTDPAGEVIVVVNLTRFCREKGLSPSGMRNAMSGRASTYKGWNCRRLSTEGNHGV